MGLRARCPARLRCDDACRTPAGGWYSGNSPMLRSFVRLAAVCATAVTLLPAQQTVWFTPLPSAKHPVGFFGSVDYMSLFSPSAPWKRAASHVQVFKLYGLDSFSDADLTRIFAD